VTAPETADLPTPGPITGSGVVVSPRQAGAQAERLVERHLRWRAWRLCARNWVGGGGELDLVFARWRTLLIVEVRSRPTHTEAFASIDTPKLQRTVLAARALVRAHKLERYRLRVDLIAVDQQGRIERRRDVVPFG
jgi:putative endonuclease